MSTTTNNTSSNSDAVSGAFIGAGGSLLNTLLGAWLGRVGFEHNQKAAYNYTKKGFREFPLAQRQGLEKAGYNPMLALGSIGGGSMPSVSQPSVDVGDIVGSAREGAKLANDITEGIKLENEKKEKEIENLESDLETKKTNRDNVEASTSLTESQKERNDLAYGRDIASTVLDAVGVGTSLYNSRQASKAREALQETVTTIHRGDKNKPTEVIKTRRPVMKEELHKNAVPSFTGSAKFAKELLMLAPAVSVGAFGGESARRSSERIHKRVKDANGKKERYWQPKRILLH